MLNKGRRISLSLVVVVAAVAATSAVSAKFARLEKNNVYSFAVAGVPTDAAAVALQVTATGTSGDGFLTVYPCGSRRPNISNVNFGAGESRSNLVLTALGRQGMVCVYSDTTADLVVDVVGSFSRGSQWKAIDGKRVLDSRQRSFRGLPPTAGSITRVPLGVDATYAALNITAVSQTSGYLTAFPCGGPAPQTVHVNFNGRLAMPNLAIVPVTGGAVCVYSSAPTDLVIDLMGWSASPTGFEQSPQQRLADTRSTSGGTRVAPGSELRVDTGPQELRGVDLLTVTAVGAEAAGYLSVYPCAEGRSTSSNNNFTQNEARSTSVIVDPDENNEVCVYSSVSTDVIVDASGRLTEASGYRALQSTRIVDTRIGVSGETTTTTTSTPPTTSAAPQVIEPAATTSSTTTTSPTTTTTTTTTSPTTTTTSPTTTTTSPTTTTTTPTTTTTSPTTTTTAPQGTPCGSGAPGDRPGGSDGFGGCWPSASSTGVPAGTPLTVVNGGMTVSTAGAVIEGKDIRGCVHVTAPGVTIRNSKIACTDFYVILHDGSASNPLVIENVEVSCNNSNGTGIGYAAVIVRRANIYGCENGFDIDRDFTVEDSYIHDIYEGATGHGDGIQLAGGANITIRHNSIISFDSNAAIISHPNANSNVIVTRNLLAGGSYTLYCPRDSSVNYQVIDNRFSRMLYPTGGAFGPWEDCSKVAVNRGNLWADTLQPLPN